MAITVRLEDEQGTQAGDLWEHPASSRLLAEGPADSCCLRFIDPYGDTLFNQLQLPVLLAELQALDGRLRDAELRLALRGLLVFLQPAVGATHTYVRFMGD